MKTLLAFLFLAALPAHVRIAVAGTGITVPAGVLVLAAEIAAAVPAVWLATRAIRRFRSSPWFRMALTPGGAR